MRSEKRKRWIPTFCLLALLIALPATFIRVQLFRFDPNLSSELVVKRLNRGTGPVVTRNGSELYDGRRATDPAITGNLVGGISKFIPNAIAYRYGAKTIPGNIGVLNGIRPLEKLQFREIRTTLLDADALEKIADAFRGKSGCCFAYNYKTGEVYTALSLPSIDQTPKDGFTPEQEREAPLLNRCLNGTYVPGSTMKIVTSICALEQSINPNDFTFQCDGATLVPEVENGRYRFHCANDNAHGSVDFVAALGRSCNAYFANLILELNVEKTQQTLRNLGFTVNGTPSDNAVKEIGLLSKRTSSVTFKGDRASDDVWGLIGQGDTTVNMVDMAMIAGAVANGGESALPYVVRSLYDPNTGAELNPETGRKLNPDKLTKMRTLFSSRTASALYPDWKNAVSKYYTCDSRITAAKTGTAEIEGVEGTRNKYTNALLIGVIEEKETAFAIVIEKRNPSKDPRPLDIAAVLADYLP